MRFTATTVAGAFVVEPEPREDARGLFARLWDQEEFRKRGLSAAFVQCNDSFSHRRGTLRGLHWQAAPHGEVKLIRCVRGAIFDVLVDVRAGSATFGRWFGVELTPENRRMLYVPEGCAHGYLTLADASEVIYPVSAACAVTTRASRSPGRTSNRSCSLTRTGAGPTGPPSGVSSPARGRARSCTRARRRG